MNGAPTSPINESDRSGASNKQPYRRLRSSRISIHCSEAAISASSRVCSTFELHDALLLLFLGHRCGS